MPINGATQITYNTKTAGIYKLKVTNKCSETDSSEEITISIINISVNAGISVTICRGDSIQLNATGTSNYFWSPSLAISNVNISNPFVKPTDTINYVVRGTTNSCVAYDTVQINTKPILAQAGADSSICFGDSIRLNGSAIGLYIWENAPFLFDDSALNTFVKPNVTTHYVLKTTNLGCSRKDTVKITVITPIVNAGTNKTICLGDTMLLDGIGIGVLSWSPKTFLLDTINVNTYTKPVNTITYLLTATIGRCVQKDTIQIVVNQAKAQLGSDTFICKGDSIQLIADVLGSFLWQTNASLITSNVLSPFVKPQTTNHYVITATSGLCTKLDTIIINVFSPVSNASIDQTICFGDSVQLNGSGFNQLKWYPKQGLTDSLNSNTFAKPINTTNYVLLAQDGNCFARDTLKISVTQVAANAGLDKNICFGDSVQLHGTSIGTYWWESKAGLSNTAVLNPYVKPINSTYYVLTSFENSCIKHDTVKITVSTPLSLNAGSNSEICFGEFIQLNATGGFNYNWIKSININDSTVANPIVKPNITTDYIVKSGFNTCLFYDTVNVMVRNLPIVDAGKDGQIYKNDSFLLLSLGQGTAIWKPTHLITDSTAYITYAKPTINTIFYLYSNDGFCKNSASTTVIVNNPTPINAGIDRTICEKDTITLNISGCLEVLWLNPLFLSDSTQLSPKAFPLQTTIFIAKSYNTLCPAIDSVKVTVKQKPIVDAGLDTTICIGLSFQLNGIATNGNIFNWEPAILLNNSITLKPIINNPKTGFYKLIVENSDGNCKTADSIKITLDSVKADFTGNITEGNTPLNVQFTNTSINANTYLWNLGNTFTSTQINPTFKFENVGNYQVILTATSQFGCVDTASITIFAYGEITIQIPNVFSPNGDLINDYFENIISNIKYLKYLNGTIWNRWGQQIYEYKMPNGKWWDGTFAGNNCP